jgi:osmotically inducible protein OsmC
MKTIQSASVISDQGREGRVETADTGFSIQLSKDGADSVTPEHLFAGAYAACFHSALKNAAERAHVSIPGSTVTANVHLDENDQGDYQLAVTLRSSLPGLRRSDAERLVHQAHTTCPYSKATRGNVKVDFEFD